MLVVKHYPKIRDQSKARRWAKCAQHVTDSLSMQELALLEELLHDTKVAKDFLEERGFPRLAVYGLKKERKVQQ